MDVQQHKLQAQQCQLYLLLRSKLAGKSVPGIHDTERCTRSNRALFHAIVCNKHHNLELCLLCSGICESKTTAHVLQLRCSVAGSRLYQNALTSRTVCCPDNIQSQQGQCICTAPVRRIADPEN